MPPILIRRLALSAALVVAVALLALTVARPVTDALDGAVLDLLQRTASDSPSDKVAVVDLGDGNDSGWSRSDLARLVERLDEAGAAAIALRVPLDKPHENADLANVRGFLQSYEDNRDPALVERLRKWAAELDHDSRLEHAIREAGNVVLVALPGNGAESRLTATAVPTGFDAPDGGPFLAPLERFSAAAAAVAVDPPGREDGDGTRRRELLVTQVGPAARLSLDLALWAVAHHLKPAALPWIDETTLRAPDGAALRFASHGRWTPRYATPADVKVLSRSALLRGQFDPALVHGRVVVVGEANAELESVPVARALPAVLGTALRVDSLQSDRLALEPAWGLGLVLGLLALAIAWAALLAPLLPSAWRIGATIALVVLAISLEAVLLQEANRWVPLAVVAFALIIATAAIAMLPAPRARRGTGTVALTHPAPTPAAPVIARNVSVRPAAPSSTPAMPAATATTAAASPSLRQISAALRDRAAEPASQADVADLLLGKAKRPPKPMLGRYEIDRELGKGAMGTVYLARDPRINRVVALKAIPLAEEFEEKNLAEVKARFFREAELAGRLKHPSIVTVHDAGEDGGLAYIAMEFVQGQVLSQFTASERLLPAAQVLEIGAQIADALDYAHRHDIVHRDIKPGNILFNRDTGETHITDFGIARLTDSTATRTGVVLGTPSFMSPEQLEGRTVKGPSDLFSLGVTLFQLLSGQLPFRADSMTGLMDKIANTPHPPLRTIRPDLAPCVSLIVDRALAKDPANRFQAGAEMSKALRACARQLAAS